MATSWMPESPPATTSKEEELEGLLKEPSSPILRSPRRLWSSWSGHRVLGVRLQVLVILAVVALVGSQFVIFSSDDPVTTPPAPPSSPFFTPSPHSASPSTSKWTSSGPVADGRVVVTGGGGNIGKEIVRRLLESSTPVTVLDKIFHSDELDEIHAELPQAKHLLRVKLGDIRDDRALREVMTDDVVGVVHLAAVSRVLWCLENEADCWDVNERGTETVLTALTDLNKKDGGRRWFVLASSREVYGDAKVLPVMENSDLTPANIYGASKLKAEQVVQRFLKTLEKTKNAGSLYVVVLRLSNIYGGVFDHIERLIPSITTQALSHQPIQIVGGKQNLDMLHIDDCVDGFLRAVKTLTKKRKGSSFTAPRTWLDTFNLASGSTTPVNDLIDMIVRFTRSKSPIQFIAGDDRFPNTYRGNTEKARKGLGFQAAVSVEEGVLRLVRLYLKQIERGLGQQIAARCTEPEPSLVSPQELAKLDDCLVHFSVDQGGELATLEESREYNVWFAGREMPLYQMRSFVRTSKDGKSFLSLRHHSEETWVGLKGPMSAGPVELERVNKTDGIHTEFEMEVNPKDSTIRLRVPGTKYQLAGPFTNASKFFLVSRDADVWPFRINPVCCKAPTPWPFYKEDPNDFMIDFQRTSLKRPFLASPSSAICSRLERARAKASRDLATVSLDTLKEPRRRLSTKPTDWANANLQSCSNSCDLPTICVDTGDCQCVLSTCTPRQRFPFASFANLPTLSFPSSSPASQPGANSLLERVKRSSWRNVLRPQASRFVVNGSPAKVHVASLSAENEQWKEKAGVGRLYGGNRDGRCLSADAAMEDSIEEMGVKAEDADMVFVSNYQGRWPSEGLYENYDHARGEVSNFDPTKVIVPFTDTWGQCMLNTSDLWTAREAMANTADPYVRSTTAWTVMADLNSPCYRPHQDVVIPPRSCSTSLFLRSLQDMNEVRPARSRRILSAFNGDIVGAGTITRSKLLCERTDAQGALSFPAKDAAHHQTLTTLYDSLGSYTSTTDTDNDSIFCLQPPGETGSSTRLVETMYAGCIPVFIGHSSQYPFFDMIDWGKISVRIEPHEIDRLEELLLQRYTMDDVERMQANIMLIRDALVYPTDGVKKDMMEKRGPLFFALHATGMRLATKWPMDDLPPDSD